MKTKWIVQGDYNKGACCVPIAYCNALIFWEQAAPKPGSDAWEIMVEIAACQHGSAICIKETTDFLGLISSSQHVDEIMSCRLPLMLSIHDPEYGCHAVLATERRGSEIHLVNYEGKPSTWIEIKDLDFGRESNKSVSWIVPKLHTFFPNNIMRNSNEGC